MNRSCKITVIVSVAAMLLTGCTQQQHNDQKVAAVAGAEGLELPLPEVPDSLRDVESRAGYIALHYWDAMDFGNVARSTDTAVVEQNFANFAAIAEMAGAAAQREAVENLMDRAATNSAALSLMRSTAERYLDDPNSPMRNEELYVVFLQKMTQMAAIGDAERLRAEYRLQEAMKNRRGSVATDFGLTLRDGRRTRLQKVVNTGDGRMTLVVFYDPDCVHCKEVMAELSERVDARRMRVLAIDAEESRERWDATKWELPAEWEAGYADGRIDEEGLYSLPASPTLYVIDDCGRVVLKDARTDEVYELMT